MKKNEATKEHESVCMCTGMCRTSRRMYLNTKEGKWQKNSEHDNTHQNMQHNNKPRDVIYSIRNMINNTVVTLYGDRWFVGLLW